MDQVNDAASLYSDPPTWDDYLDYTDRAWCAPDSPHMLDWTAEELAARFNRKSQYHSTVELAQQMLDVEWPKSDGVVVGEFRL